MPLKQSVIRLLDQLSPDAKALGAVNCLHRTSDGSLVGHNTDWIGLHRLIVWHTIQTDRSQSCALVIGSGGTAHAAVYALIQAGLQRVLVWNRTLSRAEELVSNLGNVAGISIVFECVRVCFIVVISILLC